MSKNNSTIKSYHIFIAIYILLAALLFVFLRNTSVLVASKGIGEYIHGARALHDSISSGDFLTRSIQGFYNTNISLLGHNPITLYILTIIGFIFPSNDYTGAISLFVAVLGLISALTWLYIGSKLDNTILAGIVGILWPLLPTNISILLGEGNLSQYALTCLIPVFITFILTFVKRDWAIIVALVTLAIILIILVSATSFTTTIKITGLINPIAAFLYEGREYYFGVSLILICIAGSLLSSKRTTLLFYASALNVIISLLLLFILVNLSDRLPSIVSKDTMSASIGFSVAAAAILVSLLSWRKLNPNIKIAFVALLVIDSASLIFSFSSSRAMISAGNYTGNYISNSMYDYSIQDGQNRQIAIIDSSRLLSKDISDETSIYYQISDAMKLELYDYVLDRMASYGNDLLSIAKSDISNLEAFNESAAKCGYILVEENAHFLLYDRNAYFADVETEENSEKSSALVIGDKSYNLAKFFPYYDVGKSAKLDDYSDSELEAYSTICLAGFDTDDISKTEERIRALSSKNIRVIIFADDTKVLSSEKEFLGVKIKKTDSSEDVKVETIDGNFTISGNLYYLDGLAATWGTYKIDDGLAAYGCAENANIVFIAPPVIDSLTKEASDLKSYVESATGIDSNMLVMR